MKLGKVIRWIIGTTLLVFGVILYAEFKREDILQQWYHLIWQWIIIHIGASITYSKG